MGTGIDLHTHSTASDGTDTPAELVRHAAAAGLHTVALTDHDGYGGHAEAAAALPPGLTLVPGVEISCFSVEPGRGRVSVHLLAYLTDPDHAGLTAALGALRESRLTRARRMVDMLVAAGLPLTWEQVTAEAGGGVVGRPHVARALVRAGHATGQQEAFDGVLGRGGIGYVPKEDLPVLDAVSLVRAAGGVSVFAHPAADRRGPVVGEETISALAAAGLDGLEVDHTDHDEAGRRRLTRQAAALGLLTTGSSDYHGSGKTVRLGAETTRPEALAAILERATGARTVVAGEAA